MHTEFSREDPLEILRLQNIDSAVRLILKHIVGSERRGRVVNTNVSYSRCVGFKSGPETGFLLGGFVI
jgi:hypothetical protein